MRTKLDRSTVIGVISVAGIILVVCVIVIVVATSTNVASHIAAPTPEDSTDFAVRSLRFKTAPAVSERVYIVDFDHGDYSYSVAMSDGGMVVLDKTKK